MTGPIARPMPLAASQYPMYLSDCSLNSIVITEKAEIIKTIFLPAVSTKALPMPCINRTTMHIPKKVQGFLKFVRRPKAIVVSERSINPATIEFFLPMRER